MIISKKKRNSEEFKRLFCTRPDDGALARDEIKQILLNACARTEHKAEAAALPEDDFIVDISEPDVTDEEVADYIVENPNEVVVTFPLSSSVQLSEKLPFFKSVMCKLANA